MTLYLLNMSVLPSADNPPWEYHTLGIPHAENTVFSANGILDSSLPFTTEGHSYRLFPPIKDYGGHGFTIEFKLKLSASFPAGSVPFYLSFIYEHSVGNNQLVELSFYPTIIMQSTNIVYYTDNTVWHTYRICFPSMKLYQDGIEIYSMYSNNNANPTWVEFGSNNNTLNTGGVVAQLDYFYLDGSHMINPPDPLNDMSPAFQQQAGGRILDNTIFQPIYKIPPLLNARVPTEKGLVMNIDFRGWDNADIVRDRSPYKNDATRFGATRKVGKFGYSAYLDGIDDRFIVPANTSINYTDNFSFEAYVMPTLVGGAYHGIVGKRAGGDQGWSVLIAPDSYIKFPTHGGDRAMSDNIAIADKWYYVVAVQDNGINKLYINGKIQATTGTYVIVDNSASDLNIGAMYDQSVGDQFMFKGYQQYDRLYNYVLTPHQIAQHYAGAFEIMRGK